MQKRSSLKVYKGLVLTFKVINHTMKQWMKCMTRQFRKKEFKITNESMERISISTVNIKSHI